MKRKERKMLKVKFSNKKTFQVIAFSTISRNVVQLLGDIAENVSGFNVFRMSDLENPLGEYGDYKTIYRKVDGGYQFSNDESVYVAPPEPEPIPEPDPPTPEEIAEEERREKTFELERQINLLKQQIDSTDYKILKCYEYTTVNLDNPYDQVELHEERQRLRDSINELELELTKLI